MKIEDFNLTYNGWLGAHKDRNRYKEIYRERELDRDRIERARQR